MDTSYINTTGYKMNIKLRSNCWFDHNDFYWKRNNEIEMRSPATSTVGFDITYLAIALGYDVNINKLLGGIDRTKSKVNFSFSCALFTVGAYSIKNDVGMNVTKFDNKSGFNVPFKGVNTSTLGIDAYYYFNNKRYSHAAAFSFSKIQLRSQGSVLLGLSYCDRNLHFDFSCLPIDMDIELPSYWKNRIYEANMITLGIIGGYGYNCILCRKFTVGVECAIIPSLAYGNKNSDTNEYSFIITNRAAVSTVYNNNRCFFGIIGLSDIGLILDSHSMLANSIVSIEMKIGWRFNL